MEITTIGLDLAKSIFQVHGVDASGIVVVRRALRRAQVLPFFERTPRCLVGIEACGTSHHWRDIPVGTCAGAGGIIKFSWSTRKETSALRSCQSDAM